MIWRYVTQGGECRKGGTMDFDDAYANAKYIPGADAFIARWTEEAAAFRAGAHCDIDVVYGNSPRQRFDLFYPDGAPKGLIVFVHGGYWLRFDKSFWSHLAAGPLAHGWAVAMPSYDLCPDVSIAQIGGQIDQAIQTAADMIAGPIRLVGHSAGGHLVARMPALASQKAWRDRLEHIMPISPVSDLAPLIQTSMNTDLKLTKEVAQRESPVHQPTPSAEVTIWVGADERPVFLDQARWLAEAWGCDCHIVPARHHFDVIDAVGDPESTLIAKICRSVP